jgi:hypothetical protein
MNVLASSLARFCLLPFQIYTKQNNADNYEAQPLYTLPCPNQRAERRRWEGRECIAKDAQEAEENGWEKEGKENKEEEEEDDEEKR